jgi:peptidoglycan/LPS O-acetylase OafA/YrhL
VHEPVVVAVGYLTGWTSPVVVLLTVPLSLALAEGFFRVVERPSHRLARRAGTMVERRTARTAARGGGNYKEGFV